jgi:hypothetical protein
LAASVAALEKEGAHVTIAPDGAGAFVLHYENRPAAQLEKRGEA